MAASAGINGFFELAAIDQVQKHLHLVDGQMRAANGDGVNGFVGGGGNSFERTQHHVRRDVNNLFRRLSLKRRGDIGRFGRDACNMEQANTAG